MREDLTTYDQKEENVVVLKIEKKEWAFQR
jgi:hypothetical protein